MRRHTLVGEAGFLNNAPMAMHDVTFPSLEMGGACHNPGQRE